MSYINPAWRRCLERFDEVARFIDTSESAAGRMQPPSFRADLYGSWVLLAYSVCQHSIDEIGRACMQLLGHKYRYPSLLPNEIFALHQKMTLDYTRRLIEKGEANSDVKQQIMHVYSSEWWSHSKLLNLDRNVWPSVVREWLRRLGADGGDLKWMSEPVPGKTETYESRMTALVDERNPIAHGQPASSILSAPLMKEWVEDSCHFMERCAMTVSLRLAQDHRLRLERLGIVDTKESLGNRTLPMEELNWPIGKGDHLILSTRGIRKKIVRVDSIVSDGAHYDVLPAGHKRVALGLSSSHYQFDAYLTP
jgi:hypothetical protein